jgi:galactose mutarotase-like enzyme
MLPTRTKTSLQIVLQNGHGRVMISPAAGASLRSMLVQTPRGPFELLVGGEGPHEPDRLPSGTGSFLMAPWPNRVRNGRITADGKAYSVPVNSGVHAIHGTIRRRTFEVASIEKSRCRLVSALGPEWPFPGKVVYEVSLDGPSLLQRMEVHADEQKFPVGVGWHPWFKRRIGGGDAVVSAPVEAVWVLDQDMTPSGHTVSPSGPTALNSGITPSAGSLDHCFRITPGRPTTLRWPSLELRLDSSPEVTHLQVYTPDGALCVEPQTCCIDAFRLASAGILQTGAAQASPGSPFIAWTRWSWS